MINQKLKFKLDLENVATKASKVAIKPLAPYPDSYQLHSALCSPSLESALKIVANRRKIAALIECERKCTTTTQHHTKQHV